MKKKYREKVKMTKLELWSKYEFKTSCDRFCIIRRGHKTIPKKCYDSRFEKEMTIHCREADKALAAYYNIELID